MCSLPGNVPREEVRRRKKIPCSHMKQVREEGERTPEKFLPPEWPPGLEDGLGPAHVAMETARMLRMSGIILRQTDSPCTFCSHIQGSHGEI